MKKNILLLSLVTFFFSGLYAQPASNIVYIFGGPGNPNSEFAGGLNDWSAPAGRANNANDADARWTFTAAGSGKGAYWGERTGINSPSKANGAMIFDSDFLDNAGVEGAFKTGVAPFPQTASLISPAFNCTGRTSVFVRFNQYVRNFNAIHTLDVSTDGGTTWVRDTINEDFENFNDESEENNVQIIDISNVAANKANVRIRFTFSGDYYFWIIDDVYVIEQPDYDLRTTTYFFPLNYATPVSQIVTDTSTFRLDFINAGSQPLSDIQLKVNINKLDENGIGELVYADSTTVVNIGAGDNEVAIDFPGTLVPDKFTAGFYRLRYEANVRGQQDYNPTDNFHDVIFRVSQQTFAKEDGAHFGSVLDEEIVVGNVYRTATSWPSNTAFKATNVSIQIAVDEDEGKMLNGKNVVVNLVEVIDSVAQNWARIDPDKGLTADNGQLKVTGIGTYSFSSADQSFDNLAIELSDFSTFEPGVNLKPGKSYIAAVVIKDPELIVGINPKYRYEFVSTVAFYQGRWFLLGFGVERNAAIRLIIEMTTRTDEVALPEHNVKIYPNPTAQDIKVDLNFDQASDGIVVLADLSGRVIDIKEFKGTVNRSYQWSMQHHPAGTYLVRVATAAGSKTTKVLVQK